MRSATAYPVHSALKSAGLALVIALSLCGNARGAGVVTFQGKSYDVSIVPLDSSFSALVNGCDLIMCNDPQFGKVLVIPDLAQSRGCYSPTSKLFYIVDYSNNAIKAYTQLKGTYVNLNGTLFKTQASDTPSANNDFALPILFPLKYYSDVALSYSDAFVGDALLYRDWVSVISVLSKDFNNAVTNTTPLTLKLSSSQSKPLAVEVDNTFSPSTIIMLTTAATDTSTGASQVAGTARLSAYDRNGLFMSEVVLTGNAAIPEYKGFASGLAVDDNGDIYILDKDQLIVIGSQVPKVTGLTPNTGNNDGTTTVTISGNRFPTDAKVSFGGTLATNVTSVSSTQIVCKAPAHANGTVDVVITGTGIGTGLTLAQSFTYVTPVPVVSIVSLTPRAGSYVGGTTVQIVGANFPADAAVFFDGLPATGIVSTVGLVTCVTPAHPALGKVDVKMTGTNIPANAPLISASAYTYLNLPPLAALQAAPNAGDPPLDVKFDITGCADPESQLKSLVLDFGDKSTPYTFPVDLSVKTVSHSYATDGTYMAALTVTDIQDASAVSTARVISGSGGGTYSGALLLKQLSLSISSGSTNDNTDSLTLSGDVLLPDGVDVGELKFGSMLVSVNGVVPAQKGVAQIEVQAAPLSSLGQRKYPEESFTIARHIGPGIPANTYSFTYSRIKVYLLDAKPTPAQSVGNRAVIPVSITLTTRRNRMLIFSKSGNNQAVVTVSGNQTLTVIRN